jgi:hypothetical protein
LRLETAVSESGPDVQDDIQTIDEQQEEEIWIDPGMKAHPVAHWDGLDDDEERTLKILIMRMISGTLNIKKLTPSLTLLVKSKGKDYNSTIKYHRGPKLSRSTQKGERKKQNELAIAAAGSHPLDKGFLNSAPTAESTPPDKNILVRSMVRKSLRIRHTKVIFRWWIKQSGSYGILLSYLIRILYVY